MNIKYDLQTGLVPAIIQDAETSTVLMLGYMNQAALEATKRSGKVTFFSRSKNRLWVKGETSGHFLMVEEIRADCDEDTLLIKAIPQGPTCHTGSDTCFRERNAYARSFLNTLEALIKSRREASPQISYTASLFEKGTAAIAQKVGEEAVEVVIEAMKDDRTAFCNEAADLLFHYLVLLSQKGVLLDEVIGVLKDRHK